MNEHPEATTAQLHYLRDITADNRVSYPDRWKMAVERDVVLDVYVPVGPRSHMILPRSAIVGLPLDAALDRVLVYYEGDRFDRGMTFDEMLHHAAGRMVCRYPTVATAVLNAATLARVGTYEVATETTFITDQTALDAWRTA